MHIGDEEALRGVRVVSHERVDDDASDRLAELRHEETQRLDVDFVDDAGTQQTAQIRKGDEHHGRMAGEERDGNRTCCRE